MALSTLSGDEWSPSFIQDLLPAAEKTALLYHLSYLCLAGFPNLERIIRRRAVETQLLFGSSEATILKCILTSKNLAEDLFPMLLKVVEKNNKILAIKLLNKARIWIRDITEDVAKIVVSYDLQNKEVASSTSEVVKEKIETDKKISKQAKIVEEIEKTVNDLKKKQQTNTQELIAVDEKITKKMNELIDYTRQITNENKGLGIFAAIVPFIGEIVKSIYECVKSGAKTAHVKALEAELKVLNDDKVILRQNQWQLELQVIEWQMKLTTAKFEQNAIPDPVFLNEVQKSLSQIQAILIRLKSFWESIAQMLDYLEQKTFAGEDLIEELGDFKDEFIKAINVAKESWISFGKGCSKASAIFQLQNKDAYKFLEINPSSLSKEEWKNEYEGVKQQLENIKPPKPSANTPAILPAT